MHTLKKKWKGRHGYEKAKGISFKAGHGPSSAGFTAELKQINIHNKQTIYIIKQRAFTVC